MVKLGDQYALRFEVGGKFVTINAVVFWSVLRDTQRQSGETILERLAVSGMLPSLPVKH